MNKRVGGFTIVELVIVIVVIGILASITVVAYRGMRERATTAAVTSAVDQWEKLVRLEMTFAGKIETGSSCAGRSIADFPAEAPFAAGDCINELTGERSSYNPDYFATWKTKDSLPSGKLPHTTLSGGPGAPAAIDSRGILLLTWSPKLTWIIWFPQVSDECGRGKPFIVTGNDLYGGYCMLAVEP